MQRRYLAFFAISFAVLLLWQMMFPPPAAVVPKQDQAAAQPEDKAAAEGEQPKAAGDAPAEDAEQGEGEQQPAQQPIVAPPVDSPHYLTLGSIDPQGPYRFAATFDSHGAVVHRLEMASGKYRDLDDHSGFLGDLELLKSQGGLEVQVVVPGSPAAAAGLERGDVITSLKVAGRKVEGDQLAEAGDLERALADTKPGQSIEIAIQRDGKTQQLTAKLIREPLDLVRPEAENILLHSDELPKDFQAHPSLEVSLASVGPQPPAEADLKKVNEELASGVWAVDEGSDDELTFSMVLPEVGLEAIKRFRIVKAPDEERGNKEYPAYHLGVEIEFRNLRSEPQTVSYSLQGPNGLPIEGFWYSQKVGRGWSGYGIRDVVVRTFNGSVRDFPCRDIAEDNVSAFGDGQSLAFMGVDAQYFAAVMIPQKETADQRWYSSFEPNVASTVYELRSSYKQRYQNASFLLTSSALELAAKGEDGDTAGHASTLFTGPKHPDLLAAYHSPADASYTLSPFVYYGWFGSIGIPQAMVGILSFFYGIVRNYGLAIILLTVLVRSCMYPLSRKQAKNMQMMQELKPEMDRITQQYKNDPQARVKAQQELWQKHNYNPMGGCLLMFIQLPIFIGLYRALMVDVDLRQAALVPGIRWCSNLAAPDMLLNWEWLPLPQWFFNGEGIFALGPYLNILPLATVGLFLLQQKMFMPPPADEQQEMMQKVMKFMMLFMSFMFFKVASGLCLYFIASSLWGIAERKLLPKPGANGSAAVMATPPASDTPSRPKKPAKQPTGKQGKAAKRKR